MIILYDIVRVPVAWVSLEQHCEKWICHEKYCVCCRCRLYNAHLFISLFDIRLTFYSAQNVFYVCGGSNVLFENCMCTRMCLQKAVHWAGAAVWFLKRPGGSGAGHAGRGGREPCRGGRRKSPSQVSLSLTPSHTYIQLVCLCHTIKVDECNSPHASVDARKFRSARFYFIYAWRVRWPITASCCKVISDKVHVPTVLYGRSESLIIVKIVEYMNTTANAD